MTPPIAANSVGNFPTNKKSNTIVSGIVRHATIAVQADPANSVHVSHPTFKNKEFTPMKTIHGTGGKRASQSANTSGDEMAVMDAVPDNANAATTPSRARSLMTVMSSSLWASSTSTAMKAQSREAEKHKPQPRRVFLASLAPMAKPAPKRPMRPPSKALHVGNLRATIAASSGVVTMSVFHSSVFVATFVLEKEEYHITCIAGPWPTEAMQQPSL